MDQRSANLDLDTEASERGATETWRDTFGRSTAPSTVATSRPLVPLLPARRRTGKSVELGVKHSSSGTKVRQGSEMLRPIARYAQNQCTSEIEIRGHHSAPWHTSRSSRGAGLRESKSAPDLREPVLAAIRGLQDGSIQVDTRTRAKIAHAARRVLKFRETQRRGLDSPLNSGMDGRPPRSLGSAPLAMGAVDTEEMFSGRLPGGVSVSNADLLQIGSVTSQDNVVTGQPGAQSPPDLGQRRSSFPFTITTGVPHYSQGDLRQSRFLSRPHSRSTPSTGLPSPEISCKEAEPKMPAKKPFL